MPLTTRQILVHGPALALLFVLAAFPSLYHGIDRPMLANVDMDLLSIYQAVSVLSGLPLDPNPHTGYFYNIVLAGWLQVFHWLDLVPTVDMTALRAAPDFEARLAALTTAGRWFSVFQAGILAGLVYAGALMLNGDRRTALVLAIVFTIGGGGLAAQSVQMRTELPSMVLIFAAALLLIRAMAASSTGAFVMLAIAGAFLHAAMTVKVQVVVLAVFLPLLPLVLAWRQRHNEALPFDGRLAACIVAVALVMGAFAAVRLLPTLTRESAGIYQLALLAYALGCAGLYGYWRLGAVWRGLAGLSAFVIGYIGFYGIHALVPDPWTNCVVFNFLEHGSQFAKDPMLATGAEATAGASPPPAQVSPRPSPSAAETPGAIVFLMERLTRLDYPFALVFAFAGLALAVRIRGWAGSDFIDAAFLLAIAVSTVAVFWAARGEFIYFYTVYVEAWVILSIAVSLRVVTPSAHRSSRPTGPVRRVTAPLLIALSILIVGANINFRLMDPTSATTRAPWNACIIIVWAPLFGDNFKAFCEREGARHANVAVNYAQQVQTIDQMLNQQPEDGTYPSGLRMRVAPAVGECVLHSGENRY